MLSLTYSICEHLDCSQIFAITNTINPKTTAIIVGFLIILTKEISFLFLEIRYTPKVQVEY